MKRELVCLMSTVNALALVLWPFVLVMAGGFATRIEWWVQVVILLGMPLGIAAFVWADRVPRRPVMVVANAIGVLLQGGFWGWYLFAVFRS